MSRMDWSRFTLAEGEGCCSRWYIQRYKPCEGRQLVAVNVALTSVLNGGS